MSEVQTYESAQRELEGIVERLERGDTSLDEAIALSERGAELYRVCIEKLETARGRIEELARRSSEQQPFPRADGTE